MTTIAVVADDLIWASRLTDAVRRAGAEPKRAAGAAAAGGRSAVWDVDGALVDTALMTADPIAVIAALAASGVPVLAVANHDDVALRKRALAAGAEKVLAYRKLHEDGSGVVERWLRTLPTGVP